MNGGSALGEYDRLLQSLEESTRLESELLSYRQSCQGGFGPEKNPSGVPSTQPEEQEKPLVPTRPQANESRKRKHSFSTFAVNEASPAHRTWPPVGPATVINATGWDPFNSFPHYADSHSYHLLHLYLHADLIPGLQEAQSAPLRESVMSIRKNQVFPVVLNSTAAYGALVSYIETTPGLPVKSHSDVFVRSHLHVALSNANIELFDTRKFGDDGLTMTVCLLMIVALRMNDLDNFRAHAQGLMALLAQRQHPSSIGPSGDRGGTSGHSSSTTPTESSSSGGGTSSNLTVQPLTTPHNNTVSSPLSLPKNLKNVTPYALLLRKRLISPTFVHQLQYQALLNMLIRPAKYDLVLRIGIQQHIFTDSISAMYTGAIIPFEIAVFSANRLFQHLTAWPALKLHPLSFYYWTVQGQHTNSQPDLDLRKNNPQCVVATRPVLGIRQMLMQSDLDILFYECPIVLIWMALLAGPASQALTRKWFAWLLKKAWSIAHRSMPMLSSFKATVRFFEREFAWGSELNLAAEVFWVGVLFSRSNHPHQPTATSTWPTDPLSRAQVLHPENFDDRQEFLVAQNLLQSLLRVYHATDATSQYTETPHSTKATMNGAESAAIDLLLTIRDSLTDYEADGPPCILHGKCPGHRRYEL